MAELNLIPPEGFQLSPAEKAVGIGALAVDLFGAMGLATTLTGLARKYYPQLTRSSETPRVIINGKTIMFFRSDDRRVDLEAEIINKLEFFYYEDDQVNSTIHRHPGTTLVFHTTDRTHIAHTLDERRKCREFLTECYAAGIPTKDYWNGMRTYRLRVMMYADIEKLKVKYGSDFWSP